MGKPLRIAMLFDVRWQYHVEVLKGLISYSQAHGTGWDFLFSQYCDVSADNVASPGVVDGVIGDFNYEACCGWRELVAAGVPSVSVTRMMMKLPQVAVDHREVGRAGARHFLAQGYENFAFCGHVGVWARERLSGYVEVLGERGITPAIYEDERWLINDVRVVSKQIGKWISKLPRPLAMMGATDLHARDVLRACGERGIKVPDEVAVLGVDNEPLCEMLSIPVSSFKLNGFGAGVEAGRILQLQLKRKPAPDVTLIPPELIIERASTLPSGTRIKEAAAPSRAAKASKRSAAA